MDDFIFQDFIDNSKLPKISNFNPISIIAIDDYNQLKKIANSETYIIEVKEHTTDEEIKALLEKSLYEHSVTMLILYFHLPLETYKLLENLKETRKLNNGKEIPQNTTIVLAGKREVLENQWGNLFNLGSNFLEL